MKARSHCKAFVFYCLLACLTCGPALAAGLNDQPLIRDGQAFTGALTQDGVELHRVEYLAASVKGADNTSAVFLLPQNESWAAGLGEYQRKIETITPEQAAVFLADNQIKADQFNQWLDEYNLNFTQLQKLVAQNPGELLDLIEYLTTIQGFTRGDAQTNASQFCNFLDLTGTGLDEFITEVEASFESVQSFLNALEQSGMSFDGLYASYVRSGASSFGQFLKSGSPGKRLDMSASAASGGITPNLVFEIMEIWVETWQFLCPTGPISAVDGAFSRVLHKDGHSTLGYRAATESNTPHYTYSFKDQAGRARAIVEFSGKSFYGARHMSLPGHWIPLVAFEVHKVESVPSGIPFDPGWSVTNGVAKLFPPHSNQGTAADPDPRCHFLVQLMTNKGLQVHYMFRVQGTKGISFLGS